MIHLLNLPLQTSVVKEALSTQQVLWRSTGVLWCTFGSQLLAIYSNTWGHVWAGRQTRPLDVPVQSALTPPVHWEGLEGNRWAGRYITAIHQLHREHHSDNTTYIKWANFQAISGLTVISRRPHLLQSTVIPLWNGKQNCAINVRCYSKYSNKRWYWRDSRSLIKAGLKNIGGIAFSLLQQFTWHI